MPAQSDSRENSIEKPTKSVISNSRHEKVQSTGFAQLARKYDGVYFHPTSSVQENSRNLQDSQKDFILRGESVLENELRSLD